MAESVGFVTAIKPRCYSKLGSVGTRVPKLRCCGEESYSYCQCNEQLGKSIYLTGREGRQANFHVDSSAPFQQRLSTRRTKMHSRRRDVTPTSTLQDREQHWRLLQNEEAGSKIGAVPWFARVEEVPGSHYGWKSPDMNLSLFFSVLWGGCRK